LKRNFAIDLFKIILVLMVIELHLNVSSNSGFLHHLPKELNYIFVDGIFRIAVPGFLLINGYFFYQAIKTNRYKNWLIRVTLIYIIWMILYSYFWFDPLKPPKEILKTILFGYWHLWYLNAVIGAGILTYMFRNWSAKSLLTLIVILFIAGLFVEYGGTYHLANSHKIDTMLNWTPGHRNFLFLGFVFFNLGFLMNRHHISDIFKKSYSYWLALLGLALLVLEAHINYTNLGNVHFDNLASLLILTPALFVIILQTHITSNSKNLSLLATAIYLIHPLFIMIYKNFMQPDNTLFTPMVYLSAIIAGVILVKLNQKFKYLL